MSAPRHEEGGPSCRSRSLHWELRLPCWRCRCGGRSCRVGSRERCRRYIPALRAQARLERSYGAPTTVWSAGADPDPSHRAPRRPSPAIVGRAAEAAAAAAEVAAVAAAAAVREMKCRSTPLRIGRLHAVGAARAAIRRVQNVPVAAARTRRDGIAAVAALLRARRCATTR